MQFELYAHIPIQTVNMNCIKKKTDFNYHANAMYSTYFLQKTGNVSFMLIIISNTLLLTQINDLMDEYQSI